MNKMYMILPAFMNIYLHDFLPLLFLIYLKCTLIAKLMKK